MLLDENRVAYTALDELIKPVKASRKPLVYLAGPAGSGKSYLIRHFLREAIKKQPKLKYVSCTAAQFAADFAQATESKTVAQFQEKYRNAEFFICEDIRALQNRPESQQQLVFTLDHILAHSGRCIVSCSCLPGELTGFSRKLVNRLRGGVPVSIALPKRKSRLALIDYFASSQQIGLSDDIKRQLADKLTFSPREISAAITQLESTSRMLNQPIDKKLVDHYLKGDEQPAPVTLSQLARAASQQFGISVKEIRSGARNEGHRIPRQCAMMLARHITQESLTHIAQFFGRKNHASVIHATKRVEELSENDLTLQQHLARICKMLGVKPVIGGS